jgi:integrase
MLRRMHWTPTYKASTATSLRRLLRWLWTNHGAPKLDEEVSKYPAIRPRSVTVPRAEIDTMLGTAPAPLRLWMLFCSHLAIRSGSAIRLAPRHYDKAAGVLRFITKKAAPVTLPVTADIADLLDRCDMNDPTPFVRQLLLRFGKRHIHRDAAPAAQNATMQRQLQRHRARLGFKQRIVAHDLRRTTADAFYKLTGDVRDVQALLGHRSLQSTIWYLDHDLRPVDRARLEIINRPAWAESKERTA